MILGIAQIHNGIEGCDRLRDGDGDGGQPELDHGPVDAGWNEGMTDEVG